MPKKKNVRKNLKTMSPWFRKRKNGMNDGWGLIPINWKGYLALFLLIGINVFAANYFNLNMIILDNYLKMGVVFLLSIFVFIEIAKRKTLGDVIKRKK